MFKYVSKPYRTPQIDFGLVKPASVRSLRETLSDEGVCFLAKLAGKVALARTAQGFPHVINRLASHMHRPSAMTRELDGLLLIEDFQPRQGFPFDVVVELGNLKELFSRHRAE
jgi:hypothetical protein